MSSITNDIQVTQQKLNDLKRLQELEEQQKLQLEQQRFLLDEQAQAEKAEAERLEAYLSEKLQFLETVRDFSTFEIQREQLERELSNLKSKENEQQQLLETAIKQIAWVIQTKLSKGWSRSPTEFMQQLVTEVSRIVGYSQPFVSRILYR